MYRSDVIKHGTLLHTQLEIEHKACLSTLWAPPNLPNLHLTKQKKNMKAFDMMTEIGTAIQIANPVYTVEPRAALDVFSLSASLILCSETASVPKWL